MVKWISVWSIAALLLFSCEKEIEFKGDGGDPLLVLNCITETDSVFKVQFQRSRFFLESTNADYNITSGAVVTLTNLTTGQVFTSSTAGADGFYSMGTSAVAGNSYSIQVTHPDYETVSSTTFVPAAVAITAVDTSLYVSESGNNMQAHITWSDPAGKDFYVLKMSVYNSTQGSDVFDLVLSSTDLGMDDISASVTIGESFSDQLFFTDALFDGSQKTLEVHFLKPYAWDPGDHYKFTLFRCNEATYKYLVSTVKAGYSNGDPFSEPVKVFTNVENGYGVFGALSRAVFIQ
jgi:hypothetical protein